ncbi:MAG: hypothetical protein ABIY37_12640 [Devosia sp.]
MNKLLFATAIVVLSAAPALAGEGLFCSGPDGIDISVPLGAGPGLSPLSAEIKAAGKVWTTAEGVAGTTQIIPAQSASVDNRLYLDFADPNYVGVVVEIRLFWAEEETDPVLGGTLRIAGHGAWPISCGMG